MLQTVKGIYRDGKVELDEAPQGVQEATVLVTFLPAESAKPAPPRQIYFGMLRGAWKPMEEEDFKAAEWHGDEEPDAG